MQIKPILTFQEGKVVPFGKVRSKKKALSFMVSKLKSDIEQGFNVKTVFILQEKQMKNPIRFRNKSTLNFLRLRYFLDLWDLQLVFILVQERLLLTGIENNMDF